MNTLAHTTPELEAHLGEPITAREQSHAWPLSSVEVLTTASGRRLVYKVQAEPTVEPEFFARARTPLLPPCEVLRRDERGAAMLFPFLQAPTLRDISPDAAGALTHGRAVVAQIGAIAGDVPVYRDLGSVESWRTFAAETLDLLAALVADGRFTRVARDDIAALRRWAKQPDVLALIDETSQLIHGDCKAEHIFLADGGYRVIDWQRPYRAPRDIDLVALLDSLQLPVRPHVPAAAVGLHAFLFVHWAAEAKTNLLPALPLFDHWAQAGIATIRQEEP